MKTATLIALFYTLIYFIIGLVFFHKAAYITSIALFAVCFTTGLFTQKLMKKRKKKTV